MGSMEIAALTREIAARWADFAAMNELPDDPEWVKRRLRLMFDADQSYRDLYVRFADSGDESARQEMRLVLLHTDAEHREWLSNWLIGREWPRLSVFGAAACEHAWMIALHSDGHPFLNVALRAVEPLLPRGEVDPVHYAALVDRVAVSEGRPQTYGMFYTVKDGREVNYPVDAVDGLAARRAGLNLGEVRFRR